MTSCSHTLEKGDGSSRGGVLILSSALVATPAGASGDLSTTFGLSAPSIVVSPSATYRNGFPSSTSTFVRSANSATFEGILNGASSSVVRPGVISGSGGCTAHASWNSTFYGWTFWMNDCAADVVDSWLLFIGGGAALTAAIQGFLNVPYDVAAIVAAAAGGLGAGALAAQINTCKALGYGGVGYGQFAWYLPYLYC